MIPWVLLALSVCAGTGTGVPPRSMDSVIRIVEALEMINHGVTNHEVTNHGLTNNGSTNHGVTTDDVANDDVANDDATTHGPTNHGATNHGVTTDDLTNDDVTNVGSTNNGVTNHVTTNGLTNHGATTSVLELARALGSCSSPGCRAVLGDPPDIPAAPPTLTHQQWLLFTQLLHREAAAPALDAVLAPDGSTVALGPLLAGIEVGLKRAAGWPGPTTEPPLDALYAVTITEALGTSYLLARGGNRTTLGPGGCWDDAEDPRNYTLLGPPSPIPDAVANGAMDGVLLGARVAQGPIPLAHLLRSYYGTGDGEEKGRPPSSYRRRDFGVLTGLEKLEEEVVAMLKVLRVLPPTRQLLEDVGPEEVAAIARRAARDFTELYVGCPPIVPRCMWGAQPYRGSPKALTLPLDSVFIHHTFSPSAPCRTFAACARALRRVQRFHQETRGWDDIGYSFVVGSDGYLYEGRGWHWVGAHTKGYNSRGYGLGYLGDFSATLPDPEALALVRDSFLPCAVRAGHLHHRYRLRGHRQMGHTQCPGDALFQEIETWHGFQVGTKAPEHLQGLGDPVPGWGTG